MTPPTRPPPGTWEEDIAQKLICQVFRAGRVLDLAGCYRLARVIQAEGHRSGAAGRPSAATAC
jgi:hypothetical protein